ncbi:MAG: ECF-type sigma factor [Thermoanaerobaculia bacterium]
MDPSAGRRSVTAVLSAAGREGRDVFEELLPLVYDELRRMAHRQLAHERRQRTLSTTGLVHEAYLKLVDQTQVPVKSRAYFFAAASHAMRQVLVDAARRRRRLKRGAGEAPLNLDDFQVAADDFAAELTDLDEALERLAALFPRQARVVECRFFGGLSVEETAEALELAPRTVKRDWSLARAWLYRELRAGR